MIAVGAFVAGAVVSAVLWAVMARQLTESEVLRRENYRGHPLPVAAGIGIVLTPLLVGSVYLLWVHRGGLDVDESLRATGLSAGWAIGFGLLGLFDDVVGATATKGFRGHLTAARHGELTTGLVKLVWGLLLGFLISSGAGDLTDALRGGVLIAAAANLANLFDRAPGRVIKVSLLGAAVVALLGAPADELLGPMVIVGAGLGLLVPDLRERCMLGDTGANVLGAAVGVGLVAACGTTGEWIALAVVVALNLASEVVSFSRVIDRVAPLRWLDRLGTLPERSAPGR